MESAPFMRGTRGRFQLVSNIGIGNTTVSVPFDQTLPTTDYSAIVGFEGDTGVLGNLTAQVVAGSRTATGCQVLVRNGALISLGVNTWILVVALY